MRFYAFSNMYLSALQQSLQSTHVLSEMFIKYLDTVNCTANPTTIKQITDLNMWAKYYKTIIVCNGGYSSALRELIDLFNVDLNPFPWASFNEDQAALDGALTCVGIILPEYIYNTLDIVAVDPNYPHSTILCEKEVLTLGPDHLYQIKNKKQVLTAFEFELVKKIKQYQLAR